MVRKILMLLVLFSLGGIPLLGAEESIKIGFVNLEKALYQSVTGKNALEEIKKDFEEKQSLINKKEGEIKRLESELLSQRLILSESVLKEKEYRYKKKIKELERMRDDLQQELDRKRNELVQNLLKRLRKIIHRIGEEEGYTAILENSLLLYQSPVLDLTEKIIQKFDEKVKEKQ